MTHNPCAALQPPFSSPDNQPPPLSQARTGFSTHKYLMLAIIQCLQERHPRRRAPPLRVRDDPTVHRWMREPSAEREVTPCIVMREHHDRGDLSVVRLPLEQVTLHTQPLVAWMRAVAPPSSQPDRDTVHLAMAPTLPGVPILVHSCAADGETFTHMFSGGMWTHSTDDRFLLRAVRYAQLVATVMPLTSEIPDPQREPQAGRTAAALPEEGSRPGDLVALGLRYDHIAVHAALKELGGFRRHHQRLAATPRA